MNISKFLPLVVTTLLLLASCANRDKVQKSIVDTVTTQVTTDEKQHIPGIQGLIVLHPIDNPVTGDGKTYSSFYDFSNTTLDFTDNIVEYNSFKNALPDSIGVGSHIWGARFNSMLAYPFVNFTKEVKKGVTEQTGIDFEKINNYQTAHASNMRIEKDSLYILQAFLGILLQKSTTAPAIVDHTPVDGGQGIFTLHPIEDTIKGIKGKIWHIFYDFDNKCAYVNDSTAIYKKFSRALPLQIKDGETENAVLVQGMAIDPYVSIDTAVLNSITREKGFKLNGDRGGSQNLNEWRILKLTNMTVVMDYKNVIVDLQNRIAAIRKPVNVRAIAAKAKTPTFTTPKPVQPNQTSGAEGVTYPRRHRPGSN